MDEKTLIEHYKKKLAELNELLDSGMLSFSEYNELVKDFKDIKAIESDIDDIKLKVFAGAVVQSLAPQIQSL
jgi:uncharacterized protein Yka (UPF0111/DUF47 family)|tara:strand:+ start:1137 stop:1352 length:216 start_codon:yes stop_codon:yes gene_type:complete